MTNFAFIFLLFFLSSVKLSFSSWWTLRHDVKIPEDQKSSRSLESILESEAKRLDLNSMYIHRLSINGEEIYGPKYYTQKPDVIKRGKSKFYYVHKLKFYRDETLPILLPDFETGASEIKKSLVTRRIFEGRDENILVGNVYVDDLNYGPILLPAIRKIPRNKEEHQ